MLTAFSNQNGSLRLTEEPLSDAVWIDLVAPTTEEIAAVSAETGLEISTEAELEEIESSSRLATENGAIYLSIPLVTTPDTDPQSIPAGFVLTQDRLITVRFGGSLLFDRFMEQNNTGMHSPAHVLVSLLEAIVDRQADALERAKAQMESISQRVFSEEMASASGGKREDALLRHTLVTLGRLGDLISRVRESQVSASRTVPYIGRVAEDWLPRDLKPRLQTLRRDLKSLNDYDTHLNDKLQFLLDATLGFVNIAQNNVMKVLTVVSVVGIPPVLVAGIYGMNFKRMPELDWAWGYAFGLAVIFLSALIPLFIFKRRDWV